MNRRACWRELDAILFSYPALALRGSLNFGLSQRFTVRPATLFAWLLVFHAIVGGMRAPEIRTFSGREDGGRRDGPIRHGGLPQAKAAFARVHLNAGMYASRSSC